MRQVLHSFTCSTHFHVKGSIGLMASAKMTWTYQKEPPSDHQATVLSMNLGLDLM